MPITFSVDDVEPVGGPHPVVTLDESLPPRIGDGLCISRGPANVVPIDMHPLVGAVHLAFTAHRPLILSPDAVWMTIAQGFSAHVQAQPEELRERFVRHEGKRTLLIEIGVEELDAEAWAELIPQFTSMIRDEVGPGLHRLLLNDFSTTRDLERTASEIGMMELFSPYFDYEVRMICGIPNITLTGTVEDWKTIRSRLDVIAEFGVADWIAKLAPVADEWVKSAEGHPDRDFWQCMYIPKETYGTSLVTGWLIRLFPYVVSGRKTIRNESLYCRPPKPDKQESPKRRLWQHTGIELPEFGGGLSVAPVIVSHIDGRPPQYYDLVGGLIGITQDSSTLALEPTLGWCVRSDRAAAIIEKLKAVAQPFPKSSQTSDISMTSIPNFYLRLLDSLGNSLSLFEGVWRLRTRDQIDGLFRARIESEPREDRWFSVTPFIDLPDGRWLAWARVRGPNPWCVTMGRGESLPPLDAPVIAGDPVELFQRALEEGPLYFDEESFLAEKTLRDFI